MTGRRALSGICAVVALAAIWTGGVHGFFKTSMTGLLPPHYGYSAYFAVALVFLAEVPSGRVLGALAALLSANRAAWVGAIAGWASLGGWRRRLLAVVLAGAAVTGGLFLKQKAVRDRTDYVRAQIWRTALSVAIAHPEGIGRGNFCVGIAGREITEAHSDLLQLLVERGFSVAGGVVALLLWGICLLPAGPEKAVVVALTATSVVDNRLHHPACAALYALSWLLAARAAARRTP
jgi:hypothetical protein